MSKTEASKIIYKYNSWNIFSKNNLINNEVYLASCSDFNDPFDAIPPFKFNEEELRDENIYPRIYELAKLKYTTASEEDLKKITMEELTRNPYRGDHLERLIQSLREGTENEFGILSLTTKNDNLLMWSHYANSHRGFCIGYDKENLIQSIDEHKSLFESIQTGCFFEKINYRKIIPEINLLGDDSAKVIKLLTTKSRDWDYEDEYRIFKLGCCRKSIKLKHETIKEIILGCKMSNENMKEIIKIVDNKLDNVKIKSAMPSTKGFNLDITEPILL